MPFREGAHLGQRLPRRGGVRPRHFFLRPIWGLNHGLTVRLNEPGRTGFGCDAAESGRIALTLSLSA